MVKKILYNAHIIRHCKPLAEWNELGYEDLLKMISGEFDPSIDDKFLENISNEKLRNLNVRIIYSSPIKRAVETAYSIANKIKTPVELVEELREIRFEDIPYHVFLAGEEAKRDYLFNKSIEYNHPLRADILEERALIITHGFIMRKIYFRLFDIDIRSLKNDRRFKNYLSGFSCQSGNYFTILKD